MYPFKNITEKELMEKTYFKINRYAIRHHHNFLQDKKKKQDKNVIIVVLKIIIYLLK